MHTYRIFWPTLCDDEKELPQGLNCPFPCIKPPNVAPWNGDRTNRRPIKKKLIKTLNLLWKHY